MRRGDKLRSGDRLRRVKRLCLRPGDLLLDGPERDSQQPPKISRYYYTIALGNPRPTSREGSRNPHKSEFVIKYHYHWPTSREGSLGVCTTGQPLVKALGV